MKSERLKIVREKKGLTQTQAAEKLGISRVNYNRYENGEREPDNKILSAMADFYDVTTDYLLGRDQKADNVIDLAAHRTDDPMNDLPDDARKSIEEFIAYVRAKYQTKK